MMDNEPVNSITIRGEHVIVPGPVFDNMARALQIMHGGEFANLLNAISMVLQYTADDCDEDFQGAVAALKNAYERIT